MLPDELNPAVQPPLIPQRVNGGEVLVAKRGDVTNNDERPARWWTLVDRGRDEFQRYVVWLVRWTPDGYDVIGSGEYFREPDEALHEWMIRAGLRRVRKGK